MKKNKKLALSLLLSKSNGNNVSYTYIQRLTSYSRMQLSRLSKEIKKRDISSILKHGNSRYT